MLKVKVYDFIPIVAAARGWNMVYARKDIVPGGYTKRRPTSCSAQKHLRGRLRQGHLARHAAALVLEIMGLPYKMVTGFPGTAQINKAMLQNEVNFTGSSLPGYTTQVIPQIINPGIGMALFHYPIMDAERQAGGQSGAAKRGHGDLRQGLRARRSASRRQGRSGMRSS